jgi:hypothetical protein
LPSARQTLEMLENINKVNRQIVFDKFFRDDMIKLFNAVILELVGLY